MTKKEAIRIFEEKKVRTAWDDETEEWYFSVIDVIDILTDSSNPRRYWSDLKSITWTFVLPFILARVAGLDNSGRLMNSINLVIGGGMAGANG